MFKYKFLNAFTIALILLHAIMPIPALAMANAASTDLPDYAPGSVVTFSSDNGSSASYIAAETVRVDVSGPAEFSTFCEALADANGAWSCQITLPSDAADGTYNWTATGQSSNASESGSFTVTAPPPPVVDSTEEPTAETTVEPTVEPTQEPIAEPTTEPTAELTPEPTQEPAAEPSPTESPAPAPLPFIQSDKGDYAPGETVTLTSGNWQSGEWVVVYVNDNLGQTWSITTNKQADAEGAFTYQFSLPTWFVASYSATATGSNSGTATTTFTDGNVQVKLAGGPTSGVLSWRKFNDNNTCSGSGNASSNDTVNSVSFTTLAGVNDDQSIRMTAPTIAGYTFNNWSGAISSTSNPVCLAGSKDNQQVIANYTSANTAPVANNDSYSTNEDAVLTVAGPGILGNDTDAQSNPLTAVLVSAPAHGTLTLNSNGSFNYTPASNYNGSDSFTYRANDGSLNSNTATVNLTISAVNDAPVAANDSYTTAEDTPVSIASPGVLGNDPDVDSASLTAILVSGPSNGTLILNSNGSFTYTPAANYSGSDSFTYNASDGSADSNVATVTITIIAVNDSPVAAADSYSTNEDTALTVAAPGVLGNDTDVESSLLNAALVDGPTHGTLIFNSDGSFTYAPDANFNGFDSFTYKANDGTTDSNTATVSITVNSVNDAPAVADDAYSIDEDTVLNVPAAGVLSNDTDPEGDTLTAVLATGPSHGTLTFNANGSVTYTSDANYHGPDSFTYKANDGTADSTVATVSINVSSVNDAPMAANDTYSTDEDTTLSIAAAGVLSNDMDVDADSLSALLVSGPSHGTLTLNADGSFEFTPAANYNGSDSFTYKADDGSLHSNLATVNIAVNAVNDAPVAVGDSYSTDEDTPLDVTAPGVLDNDSDLDDDSLTASVVSGPSHGTLTLNPNGSLAYMPAANYNGLDSFTYKANDSSADSNTVTVSITVNAVNDAPVAVDDTYVTAEDNALNVVVPGALGNDSDIDSAALAAILVTGPEHGTLTLHANGSFTYTPDANYYGSDSFTYKANDGIADSNTATVSITITAVNDAPVLDPIEDKTIDEQILLSFTATASDVDNATNTLTFSLTGEPDGASIDSSTGDFRWTPREEQAPDSYTFDMCVSDGDLDDCETIIVTVEEVNVTPVLDAIGNQSVDEGTELSFTASASDDDIPANSLTFSLVGAPAEASIDEGSGVFTWTPADNGMVTFTVQVCDDGSPVLCDDESITVTANNVTPMVNAGADATIDEGDTFSGSGSFTDPGADSWTATVDYGNGSPEEPLMLNPDKTFSLSNAYADDGAYTVSVCVTDDDGGVNCDELNVTVINVAPTLAISGAADVDEGSLYILNLNSSDPGTDTIDHWKINWGDGSSETVVGNPGLATHVYADGANEYTISATATDEDGTFAANSQSVDVNNVAPSLTISGDEDVNEGSSYTLSLSSIDLGADTWNATVEYGDGSSGQPLSLNPDKTFSLSHLYADNGSYTVTVCVTDDDADVDCDTLDVTVSNVAPTAAITGAPTGTAEGTAISLGSNVTDPSSVDMAAGFTYAWSVTKNGNTYVSGTSGSFSFTPDDNGTYLVSFSATDKDGSTGSDTKTITVTNVAPTLSSLSLTGESGAACTSGNTVNLSFSFTDPGSADIFTGRIDWGDGNTTSFTSSPANVSHTYAAGSYMISVTVTDDDSGADSDTATVSHLWNLSGILQPINPGPPNSVFKYGSTIPVKVTVTDCNNTPVGTLTLKVTVQKLNAGTPDGTVSEPYSTSAADTGNTMRYTGAPDNQYIFNLASRSLSDSTATYRIYVSIWSGAGASAVEIQKVSADIGLKLK